MARFRHPILLLSLLLLGLAATPAHAGRANIDPDGQPAATADGSGSLSEGRANIDPDG